ncbi:hypothetical protein ACGFWE_41005 [Streptomyces sp. NPDC048523]|uniref:hypothetical protein n=1 Tax=Streptomyces sp. NPDC048523 TaxID=3365567 RepID=UPI00371938A6
MNEQQTVTTKQRELGPASDTPESLRDRLDEAFRDAGAEASCHVGPSGSVVSVTLYTRMLSFEPNPEGATVWLQANDIDADARFDSEGLHLVVDLHTPQAVARFTDLLLAPHVRTRAAAAELAEALSTHYLSTSVRPDLSNHTVELRLHDNADLHTTRTVAEVLGAPGIDEGLDLSRKKHLRRLAERLTWLITGITTAPTSAVAVPECAHTPDQITLCLTQHQARQLTTRIQAVPPPEPDIEPTTA